MKKIVALIMASVLTLSLCSCWGGSSSSGTPTDSGVQDVSKDVLENVEDDAEKEPVLEEENK